MMESNILCSYEQTWFLDILLDRLKQQHVNIKAIDTKLLFRASDYDNDCGRFQRYCGNKGATITIIQNEDDHTFGGYLSKSWHAYKSKSARGISDPKAFLFMIRPTLKCIDLKKSRIDDETAATCMGYGPLFGEGWDISIENRFHTIRTEDKTIRGGGKSSSFEYLEEEMFGKCAQNSEYTYFDVRDYEVFSIILQ